MRRSGHLVPRFTGPLEELPADVLTIPVYEMRRLGYWMADRVIEYFERGDEGPAVLVGDPHDLAVALGGPVSQKPGDLLKARQALAAIALPRQQHGEHARYFAQVPRPSSYPGVLGEWLSTGYQTIAASWVGGSGPATMELVVCEWLASLMALPDTTGGVLLSGASMANITGLVAVRNVFGAGVIYLSDQTRSSIGRGLRSLRLADDELRVLTTDDQLRLPVDGPAVADDRRSGRRPLMGLGQAVERGIVLAERAEQLLREDPMWEVVTPAPLGIVTWAVTGATSQQHSAAAAPLTSDGYASVTTTSLQGRSVLRLCMLNPHTTEDDLRGTLRRLAPYLGLDQGGDP